MLKLSSGFTLWINPYLRKTNGEKESPTRKNGWEIETSHRSTERIEENEACWITNGWPYQGSRFCPVRAVDVCSLTMVSDSSNINLRGLLSPLGSPFYKHKKSMHQETRGARYQVAGATVASITNTRRGAPGVRVGDYGKRAHKLALLRLLPWSGVFLFLNCLFLV